MSVSVQGVQWHRESIRNRHLEISQKEIYPRGKTLLPRITKESQGWKDLSNHLTLLKRKANISQALGKPGLTRRPQGGQKKQQIDSHST